MKRTAVEWLVEAMQQRGVAHIAALCGHGLDPLFDAASRAGIRIIDTRNEQTAGYIAECYGRLTRRPVSARHRAALPWRMRSRAFSMHGSTARP